MALTISPAFSWTFSIALSSTPTVADTSDQARICGNRLAAAWKPSPMVHDSPLNRSRAQLMSAELQKTMTK